MDRLLSTPRSVEADPEAIAAACCTSSWLMVVGRCGPELLEAILCSAAPLLAVVPDETAVEELHEHWRHDWPEQLQVAEQLVGAEPGELAWFRYNDPRHNGITPPETLQRTSPNLKLQHLELREQITLSQALQGWPAAQADGGTLLLIGSVAEALQGPCSSELKGLQRLLWLPAQGKPMLEQLVRFDQLLRTSWMVRDPAASAAEGLVVWEHDPRLQFEATVLAERDQLSSQRDQLTAERDQLSSQRDQLTAERDQLAAERDGLQQRMEAINRELDEILVLMDQAMPEPAAE
jgi:hypothetical protein